MQVKHVIPRLYIWLCTKSLPLHPIFCAGAVCKVHEIRFAELWFFELPEIFQFAP